jgi:hypothetical protein
MVREIAPETTMPLEQRGEPLVLPVRSSEAPHAPLPPAAPLAPVVPIAPSRAEAKPDQPERITRIAEVPASTHDPRADYFTPGRYAPARPGTPVLKAPAAEFDDRRRSRSLAPGAGAETD